MEGRRDDLIRVRSEVSGSPVLGANYATTMNSSFYEQENATVAQILE